MTVPILDQRRLNRALLARQGLLERAEVPLERLLEQVGGLQTQYAPAGYIGLWSRLAGFERPMLTAALEQRPVIQATLMRPPSAWSRRWITGRWRSPCARPVASGGCASLAASSAGWMSVP